MSRWQLIVLPIALTVVVGATAASGSSTHAAITTATLAPYQALESRDAAGLCADFTPAVAARLVPSAPAGSSCAAAAAELLGSASASLNQPSLTALTVDDIVVHGDRASASLVYTKVQHKPHFTSVGFEVAYVTLEKVAGRWLLATQARLTAIPVCASPARTTLCPTGARELIFVIAPLSGRGPSLPPVPAAVKRAGGSELRAFKAGRTVYAQSGCAACHRIGVIGNRRPGPNLTHVGSALSKSAIRRAILDPTQPMPSFKNLPRAKLAALVEFLSLLR